MIQRYLFSTFLQKYWTKAQFIINFILLYIFKNIYIFFILGFGTFRPQIFSNSSLKSLCLK